MLVGFTSLKLKINVCAKSPFFLDHVKYIGMYGKRKSMDIEVCICYTYIRTYIHTYVCKFIKTKAKTYCTVLYDYCILPLVNLQNSYSFSIG